MPLAQTSLMRSIARGPLWSEFESSSLTSSPTAPGNSSSGSSDTLSRTPPRTAARAAPRISPAPRTSLLLEVTLCPLGPAFIAKGKVGRHFKSISRNGLIILMSTAPLQELAVNAHVRLRLAIWHRAHLPNERATPYGLLLHATPVDDATPRDESHLRASLIRYHAALDASHSPDAALSLELGGRRFLNFFEALSC